MLVAMNGLGDSLGRQDLDDTPKGIGMLGVWVNECFSTGELRITSTDPGVQPIIEENMLHDAGDLERMRDGVRRLSRIARHDCVDGIAKSVLVSMGGLTGTGSPLSLDELDALNDGDLDELCLQVSGDAQHATSTCRMGAADDTDAVVDPACRVRGLDNLRVVDASIMPTVPCTNTHLTTVMIAEKIAAELA